MMVEHAQSRKKTRLIKLCAIFIVLLVLLTFLSKTIAGMMLPEVETYEVQSGTIAYAYSGAATIIYQDEYATVPMVALPVSNVYVKQGDQVSVGAPLFKVDVGDVELERRTQELAISRLKQQVLLAADSATAAQLQEELSIAESALTRFTDTYPVDGIYYANAQGTVDSVTVSQFETTYPSQTAVGIVNKNGGRVLRFMLPFEAGNNCFAGDSATVTYHARVMNEDTGEFLTKSASIKTTINHKAYLPDTNQWQFEAPFAPEEQEIFRDMPTVEMQRGSEKYEMVVPLNAVSENGQGQKQVFLTEHRQGLFGEETFVKSVDVTVLEQNDFYAAIQSDLFYPGALVAKYSTKPLTSGMTVKVK